MINSKLIAYRKEEGEWIKVRRFDLLNLSEVEYEKYKAMYSPYFQFRSEESPKLVFNKGQKTFRYLPNQFADSERSSVGMTISHILAQEVLSEMKVLKFNLKDCRTKPYISTEYEIEVDNIILEKELFDRSYRVDLLVYFSKPAELALKWGGRFALEVLATHDVGGKKIDNFEKNKLALIEVVLGGALMLRTKLSEIDEQTEENKRCHIRNSFMKEVRGNLWVSPTSDKLLLDEVYNNKNDQIKAYKENESNYKEENTRLSNRMKALELALSKEADKNAALTASLENKTKELEKLQNRSFGERIKSLWS